MTIQSLWSAADVTGKAHPIFRPGDLVMTAAGYPTLYEVLRVEPDGLLRVRGNNWAPGYSVLLHAHQVRVPMRLDAD